MPLAANSQTSHVIIHKLTQPHRFDYVMHCACGFMHNGFVNPDVGKGDPAEAMRDAARQHLLTRHGVPVEEFATEGKWFEVAPEGFEHTGGLPHAELKRAIAPLKLQAKANAVAKASPVVAAQTPVQAGPNVPTKPSEAQGGGVKK